MVRVLMLLKVFRHSAIHIKKTQQHNGAIVPLCVLYRPNF